MTVDSDLAGLARRYADPVIPPPSCFACHLLAAERERADAAEARARRAEDEVDRLRRDLEEARR